MNRIILTLLCSVATTPAFAGGWETGKLDTSPLYQSGNYVELSYGALNYSLNATQTLSGGPYGTSHGMAKDQNRMAISGKFNIGKFDIMLSSFGSGAIQMDGQAATAPSLVPSADIKLDTQAILARYKIDDNFSAIGGLRKVNLQNASVQTFRGTYDVNAVSKTGMLYGVVYERPEIAMRFEIVRSAKIEMAMTGGVTPTGSSTGSGTSGTMAAPEATTLNFQTGIAKDTLLMASVHQVKWKSAQIKIATSSSTLDIASKFNETTSYSLGLGRKLSEATSVSFMYSWEQGAGTTSESAFTMSNGSKTLSAGIRHKIGAVTISGGVGYTKVGDVAIDPPGSPLAAKYTNNYVTSVGLKVAYNF
jgi:long-chain fatty acid transport protein